MSTAEQRNNAIETLNAGPLDAKQMQSGTAINASESSRSKYKVGMTFFDTDDNAWKEIVSGSSATSWVFKFADQKALDIAAGVDVDNNTDQVRVRDDAFNILAYFDASGLNIKVINLRDGEGAIEHTINKSWIDIVSAGISKADLAKLAIDALTESVKVTTEDDRINFKDLSQNVIAFFDAIGLNINNIVGYGNEWRFMDDQNPKNIIAKLDANGLQARLLDKNGNEVLAGGAGTHWLGGNEFYSICDSLGAGGVFQDKLAELTGGIFDQNKNINVTYPLSVGGTRTINPDDQCGQWRAVNMQRQGITNPFLILIQNINDYNLAELHSGSSTDFPFMLLALYDYGTIYADYASAPALSVAMLQSVAAGERKVGTCFRIPYYSSSVKNLEITGTPSANGNIILTVGGTPYNIAVLTTDTIADILTKILEVDYAGYTDTANGDGVSVDFSGSGTATLAFDANGTGVTANISDGTAVIAYKSYYFMSKDVATDWENTAKWLWYTSISLWSAYKGLIEWLKKTYPNALLAWMSPTRISVRWTDTDPNYVPALWYADGSPNIDYYQTTDGYTIYDTLVNVQKQVCEMYGIKHLNVYKQSDINLINVQTFYPEGNVHPLTAGYERWAETIFKNL